MQIAQYLGTGKRKTSVARVILRPGDGKTWINGRTIEDYFPRPVHRKMAVAPLEVAGAAGTYDIRVRVHGGGISGQAGAIRHGVARALVEADPELRVSLKRQGFLTRDARQVERKKAGLHKARKAPSVLASASARPRRALWRRGEASSPSSASSGRKYFGTDGIRGVVGESLTPELVELIGRAATTWAGRGRVLVGRDTRGTGPVLEEMLVRGIVSAGGVAVLGGVLPTPAVALLAQDLGAVVSASHNPPEYNGVKLFDHEGRKLTDVEEAEIEALMDDPGPAANGGSVERLDGAVEGYLDHVLDRFGTDLSGLHIAVDCANGAYSGIAPAAFERLGATVTAIANAPDGDNINVGCGATDLAMLRDDGAGRWARSRDRVRR